MGTNSSIIDLVAALKESLAGKRQARPEPDRKPAKAKGKKAPKRTASK